MKYRRRHSFLAQHQFPLDPSLKPIYQIRLKSCFLKNRLYRRLKVKQQNHLQFPRHSQLSPCSFFPAPRDELPPPTKETLPQLEAQSNSIDLNIQDIARTPTRECPNFEILKIGLTIFFR